MDKQPKPKRKRLNPGRVKGEVERAHRRHVVSELYLKGHSQHAIAVITGYCQSLISKDINVLLGDWEEHNRHNIDRHKAHELAVLARVEREAWAEWDMSKRVAETLQEGTKSGTTRTRKGQTGDARYLKIVIECVQERCAILGLYSEPWADLPWDEMSDDAVKRIMEGEDPRTVMAAEEVRKSVEAKAGPPDAHKPGSEPVDPQKTPQGNTVH